MCDDGGTLRAIVKPAAGQLVITEFMREPGPRTTATPRGVVRDHEHRHAAFDLNGLGLDRAGDVALPMSSAGAKCISLAAGAFALFARGADPASNGGLAAVDATFGLSMVDTAGNVQVVDPASCGTTAPYTCSTVYDAVTWSSSTKGASKQVIPGMYTTTANDAAASFCPGVATYGTDGNLGTPGTQNSCM